MEDLFHYYPWLDYRQETATGPRPMGDYRPHDERFPRRARRQGTRRGGDRRQAGYTPRPLLVA